MRTTIIINAVTAGILACMPQAFAAEQWQQQVATGLGKQGSEMPGGVYRVGLPRTDLKVTLDGVEIKPGLALGSWLAFRQMGQEVMVMGDLVLTDQEVNPVIKRLGEAASTSPPSTTTCCAAHRTRCTCTCTATATRRSSRPRCATPSGRARPFGGETAAIAPEAATQASTTASTSGGTDIDTAAIDQALERKGKANGAVYQVSVPRAETPKDSGMEVPEAMGSAIAINFQATGAGKVATTGDFVLTADEVNPWSAPCGRTASR